MLWSLRIVFCTRRGWRHLALNALATFGLISGFIQFYSAVWVPGHALAKPSRIALLVALVSLAYGMYKAWPKRTVRRAFGRPEMTVTVTVGDMLERKGQIVVGFTDTFDTQVADGVINSASLQGQLLEKVYGGDLQRLDRDIELALSSVALEKTELRSDKANGKLKRYPVGTVAILNTDANKVYAVAYSSMGNDLVAKSNVQRLWYSLGKLWDAVYRNGQRDAVAMPLVGSELARINCLDRESLLKMSLLSFVSRSREDLICKSFTVVIHPKDHDKINMLEVEAFLRSL